MTLAVLKRSDVDLVLPVACDAPNELAAELSALQPFTVEVVAVWPASAGKLAFAQQALWPSHAGNGWFHAAVFDVTRIKDNSCQRRQATDQQCHASPIYQSTRILLELVVQILATTPLQQRATKRQG